MVYILAPKIGWEKEMQAVLDSKRCTLDSRFELQQTIKFNVLQLKGASTKSKNQEPCSTENEVIVGQDSGTMRLDLANTYLFTASAEVLGIYPDAEGQANEHTVVLDQTVFHPQGGGQPSDTGLIKSTSATFEVRMVKLIGNTVHHKGTFQGTELFAVGDTVQLEIDEEKRRLFARLHSAGHLIDSAVANLGYYSHLKPSKGYHFPDGPYVEYIGKLTEDQKKGFVEKMNEELKKLVEQSSIVEVNERSAADLKTNPPQGLILDMIPDSLGESQVRIVTIADQPCPCEGTHVLNVADICQMYVTKIKNKKGNLRVSYSVS